jgi:type IV pilus assembly protein PilC
MPVYLYTAKDRLGNQTKGTLEAETDTRAAALLREQGLWVTEIRSTGGRPAAPSSLPRRDTSLAKRLRSPVSLKDLSLFYRQLYTLLNSGVAFYQSMDMLSQGGQTSNVHLRRVIAALARHVLDGGRLSEGMARYPWLFDRMQVRMIEAGEAGGLLVEICRRLADYLEREYETRLDIKRKTLYPKLVFLLLLLVLPINVPLTLQGYLRDLGSLLFSVAITLIPLWLVLRLLFTSQVGKELFDQIKLAVPVIGPLVRKMAVARFARGLAALYGAGVALPAGIAMSGEASGNYLLERASERMVPGLERGVSVAQVLSASRFFPPMFLGMVATGESTGNLDEMLDKAADFYEEESKHAATQLVVILGVVALIVMAILVLIKLVAFYAGLFGGIMDAAGGGGAGE